MTLNPLTALTFLATFAIHANNSGLNQERDFSDPLKDDSIRQLIEHFEKGLADGALTFMEEQEFEDLIDYYVTRNDLHTALTAADQAISQYSYSSSLLLRKAHVVAQMKKYPRALEILDQAENLDPGDPEIYFMKAEIYAELGKHERAIEVLCKAEDICDPSDVDDIYLTMAEVYESWERFDKAFHFLRKSLKANPDNEDALYRLWFIVNLTERYDESVALHLGIIEQNPYAYLAWYNIGQAYFGLGLFEKAAEAFEYVTLINDGYEMAFRDWAEALFRCGEYPKAISVLEEAVTAFEPDELAYFKLGMYTEKTGDLTRARKYYREVVKLDPFFSEAFVRTALIFMQTGQPEEAQRSLRKAIRVNPENPSYHTLMAEISVEVGDLESATQALRSAATLQPSVPDHWMELGRHLLECGSKPEALEAADRGIEHCGHVARLLYLRSAVLFTAGQRHEAILELGRALTTDPTSLSTLFDIAPRLREDAEVSMTIEENNR